MKIGELETMIIGKKSCNFITASL